MSRNHEINFSLIQSLTQSPNLLTTYISWLREMKMKPGL
jgi:hypothetical protein